MRGRSHSHPQWQASSSEMMGSDADSCLIPLPVTGILGTWGYSKGIVTSERDVHKSGIKPIHLHPSGDFSRQDKIALGITDTKPHEQYSPNLTRQPRGQGIFLSLSSFSDP